MLNAQAKEINDLQSEKTAFYKNPYVWAFIGLAVGVYVGKK